MRRDLGGLALAFLVSFAAEAQKARAQTVPVAVETPRCGALLAAGAPIATPAITAAELCATIAVLAADSLEGREAGTSGEARAAEYLAARFAALGLAPPAGGYRQTFTFPAALKRDPHAAPIASAGEDVETSANLIGIVAGADGDSARSGDAIVIGAHYDHLGFGGGGSLAPEERAVHNGADDNASGVAGLLELAGHFAANPPARTLVFIAFGAEELGTLGSQHYIREPVWPLERTIAMLNLDMIGRLRETLTIYGTGTAEAWPGILARAGAPPSDGVSHVPDGFGPSDHASFYGAHLPVLALFTGAHDEYHRPGDDLETIDPVATARVVELAARVLDGIANGDGPLAYVEAPVTQRQASAFRVGLGVIPDYAFAGPGVRLASVRPGSPAALAGLAADDVLLRLDGHDLTDVYGYTAVLGALEADHPVALEYRRGAGVHRVTVTPAAR